MKALTIRGVIQICLCMYGYSCSVAQFQADFQKKLSNSKAEIKNGVARKKVFTFFYRQLDFSNEFLTKFWKTTLAFLIVDF